MVFMALCVWSIFLPSMLPEVSSTKTTCFGIGGRFSGATKWTKYPSTTLIEKERKG